MHQKDRFDFNFVEYVLRFAGCRVHDAAPERQKNRIEDNIAAYKYSLDPFEYNFVAHKTLCVANAYHRDGLG